MPKIPRWLIVFGLAVLLTVVALYALEVATLAKANAPLARVWARWPWFLTSSQPILLVLLAVAMTLLADRLRK